MKPLGDRVALGWASSLLSWVWVAWCYRGLGPTGAPAWWAPTGSWHRSPLLEDLASSPFAGADVAGLTAPALALCAATFALTAAALPRSLALGSVPSSALFAFYGLHAPFPWEFFGGSGSLTILATGLVIGAAAASPLLARRWRTEPGPSPAGCAVALALFAIGLQCHTTGWDTSARFNLSPWPAVPIFGLDIAGYTLAGLQLAVGVALASTRVPPAPAIAGGLALLVSWHAARFGWAPTGGLTLTFFFALAVSLARAALSRSDRALLGRDLTVGGLLLAVPLLAGHAIAEGDHAHTRHVAAERLIQGLAAYYNREEVYPDELAALVASGDLEEVPTPRIGFAAAHAVGLLEAPRFEYRSLGSSYVLEFASTEWVQCVYSPPWIDEDEPPLDEEAEEPWACPGNRPELW
jgi:hypothetical protein